MGKKFVVSGVKINAEDSRVSDAKSVEDIKKLFIFSHLEKDQKEKAEKDLWNQIEKSREDLDEDEVQE